MKILDMHCDTISELLDIRRKGDAARIKENTLRSNGLHIDLEKMKKADYLLQNFALFVHLSSCENPLEEVLELSVSYTHLSTSRFAALMRGLSSAFTKSVRFSISRGQMLSIRFPAFA